MEPQDDLSSGPGALANRSSPCLENALASWARTPASRVLREAARAATSRRFCLASLEDDTARLRPCLVTSATRGPPSGLALDLNPEASSLPRAVTCSLCCSPSRLPALVLLGLDLPGVGSPRCFFCWAPRADEVCSSRIFAVVWIPLALDLFPGPVPDLGCWRFGDFCPGLGADASILLRRSAAALEVEVACVLLGNEPAASILSISAFASCTARIRLPGSLPDPEPLGARFIAVKLSPLSFWAMPG